MQEQPPARSGELCPILRLNRPSLSSVPLTCSESACERPTTPQRAESFRRCVWADASASPRASSSTPTAWPMPRDRADRPVGGAERVPPAAGQTASGGDGPHDFHENGRVEVTQNETRPRDEAGAGNRAPSAATILSPNADNARPSVRPRTAAVYTASDLGVWYWRGVRHERHRIAEAWTELDECWRPLGPQGHAERVQARRDLFQQCAEQSARKAGRKYVEYRGGPVDWETGRPVAARRHLVVAA